MNNTANKIVIFALTFYSCICMSLGKNALPKTVTHTNNVQYSTITCTYKLVFRIDSLARSPRTEYFRLLISGNNSVFQSKRQLLADSIFAVYDAMPFNQEVANSMTNALSKAPQSEFSYEIYKDTKSSSITYVDVIEPKKYSYTESISDFGWQITPDSRVINGYKCQQAKTFFRGRHYTAWFTRQIPIPDGPYKFSGLPGLIVQIQDGKGDYNFELISIRNTNSASPITISNKIIGTTRKEFLQAIIDFNNSFIERATQNKVTFSNPELARKTFQENLDKRNNPLELR